MMEARWSVQSFVLSPACRAGAHVCVGIAGPHFQSRAISAFFKASSLCLRMTACGSGTPSGPITLSVQKSGIGNRARVPRARRLAAEPAKRRARPRPTKCCSGAVPRPCRIPPIARRGTGLAISASGSFVSRRGLRNRVRGYPGDTRRRQGRVTVLCKSLKRLAGVPEYSSNRTV
jgi:hypothetical protein